MALRRVEHVPIGIRSCQRKQQLKAVLGDFFQGVDKIEARLQGRRRIDQLE